ncbi:MAG: hypothetical protein COB53_06385 [Elusimicrobia bacterium]|nr:MAG: hypothetical protein COB53_06385 [Elusimicrobiota bacterium]
MLKDSFKRDELVVFASALAAASVYIFTLGHTAVGTLGDSLEVVAAASVWGIPHAPGYPFYIALCHLFTKLPLLSDAGAVHLLHALVLAASTGLIAHLVLKETDSPAAAWTGALMFAFSRYVWLKGVSADALTLSVLFALLLLVLIGSDRPRSALAAAFLFGLAFSHHQTIVLALPALAVRLSRRPGWRDPGFIGRCAVISIFGVVIGYALVYPRALVGPPVSWGNVSDLESLYRLFVRADFGGMGSISDAALGGAVLTPAKRLINVELFFTTSWSFFTPLGIALSLLGLVSALKRRTNLGWTLLMWLVIAGPVYLYYLGLPPSRASDQSHVYRFFLLPQAAIGIAIGLGAARALEFLPRGAWVLALLPLWPLAAHAHAVSRRHVGVSEQYLVDLVRFTPENSILIVSGDPNYFGCDYIEHSLRRMAGRVCIDPKKTSFPWYSRQLSKRPNGFLIPADVRGKLHFRSLKRLMAAALDTGRPVFLLGDYLRRRPEIMEGLFFHPRGLLMNVARNAPSVPRPTLIRSTEQLWALGHASGSGTLDALEGSMELTLAKSYAVQLTHLALFRQGLGDERGARRLHRRAQLLFAGRLPQLRSKK